MYTIYSTYYSQYFPLCNMFMFMFSKDIITLWNDIKQSYYLIVLGGN